MKFTKLRVLSAIALCSLFVFAPATGEAKARKKVYHKHYSHKHHVHHHRARKHRAHKHRAHRHHTQKSYSGAYSGIASWYGHTGNRTASGERTNLGGLTAAHRTLPLGTRVRVTNTRTGQSVVVRINDRGPFIRGRVIDLTPAGARAIGMVGLAPVSLSVVN
jgi:rare lipoprotein A (peptidoglycan hydrolase)